MPDYYNRNQPYDYSSDYDDDDSDFSEEFEYEPEESSATKYNLALCYLYREDTNTQYHHLVHIRLKKYDSHVLQTLYRAVLQHTRLEIAQCVYLPSGHCIAILKTFWLRIIQRAWKKVYQQRKRAITNPAYLASREIFSKLPRKLPGLRGLLSALRSAAP